MTSERRATDRFASKALTQAEVDALPEGADVWVKWSGGNGPLRYRVTHRCGRPSADTVPPSYAHSLEPCGEHPLTQVWLDDPRFASTLP